MLCFCGRKRQLRFTLAFGWKGEASKAYELAQGTWQGPKPQVKPCSLCLWVHGAFQYIMLPLVRKSSTIRKSPTLSVSNHSDSNCPVLEAEAQTNQTWLMGSKAWPREEQHIMLEHGKGGRHSGFMGKVGFEVNLER